MSIYSDYKTGALSDYTFREACKRENARERYYEEQEDLQIDDGYDDYEEGVEHENEK